MSTPLPPSTSTSSPSVAPTSTPPLTPDSPVEPRVRFEEECVLIPEPLPTSRIPRLITKSYSLPLWKRKPRDSDVPSDSELEDEPVVLKLSIPSFTTKSRLSGRCEMPHEPLVSCIVHRDPSSPEIHQRHLRRVASPPPRPDLVTVPLRPCCPDCFASTEECLREGDKWKEHFTRGASRRRSSSVEHHVRAHNHYRIRDATPGFDAMVAVDEVERWHNVHHEVDVHASPTSDISVPDHVLLLRRTQSLPDSQHPATCSIINAVCPLSPPSPIPEEGGEHPVTRTRPLGAPPIPSSHISSSSLVLGQDLREKCSSEASDSSPPPCYSPTVHLLSAPHCGPISIPLYSESHTFPKIHMPFSSRNTDSSSPLSAELYPHPHPDHVHSSSPTRKRTLIHIPGPVALIKASTEMLRGVNVISGVGGGMSMSV